MAFVCPECARSFSAAGFCTEHGLELSDAALDPLLGSVVASFRIARLLGRGGMGEVYLGVHPEIGSRVAIKVLAPHAASSAALVDRFFAEARAVNVIRHEGIVNVLDLARLPDGRPYITMEYLDGAPLSAVLARHRPAPLGALVELVLGVLDALGAAHAHGITHRDLKPDNVFVTPSGRPKLLDFGVAKLRPDLAQLSSQTRTGALLGTPFYMSPEQARGMPVDARSDLYALGVILYEGACGRRPFEAESLYELLELQIKASPERPSHLRPDLPPALESIIVRALDKNPDLRFQNSAEFAHALRDVARFLPADGFVSFGASAIPKPTPGLGQPAALSPTTAGYAATMAAGRSPLPLAPFIVLGIVSVLALMAATAFGTLLVFGDGDQIEVVEIPAGSEPDLDPDDDPTSTPSAPPLGKVDPVVYYPKALELARGKLADAELQSMVVSEPDADGRIDTDDSGVATFTFVSRSAPKTEVPASCSVWVILGGEEPTVSTPLFGDCSGGVRPPRCSVQRLVRKLGASGESVVMTYGPKAEWLVIDDKHLLPQRIADDC